MIRTHSSVRVGKEEEEGDMRTRQSRGAGDRTVGLWAGPNDTHTAHANGGEGEDSRYSSSGAKLALCMSHSTS